MFIVDLVKLESHFMEHLGPELKLYHEASAPRALADLAEGVRARAKIS